MTTRIPKVGDRVAVECYPDMPGHEDGKPGTVIDVGTGGAHFSVQRDDDMAGAGKVYTSPQTGTRRPSWLCYKGDIEEGSIRFIDETYHPIDSLEPEPKHIMGLSPEEIDWSAHKAFTRDMK